MPDTFQWRTPSTVCIEYPCHCHLSPGFFRTLIGNDQVSHCHIRETGCQQAFGLRKPELIRRLLLSQKTGSNDFYLYGKRMRKHQLIAFIGNRQYIYIAREP